MARVWNDKAETFWEKELLSLSQNDFKCCVVLSLQTGLKFLHKLEWPSIIFFTFENLKFGIFFFFERQWRIFENISCNILQKCISHCQVSAVMAYFFVKKPPLFFSSLHPSLVPQPYLEPTYSSCVRKPLPIPYASLWNQERLKIRGLVSPPNPVIQQNNAF